jgi:hypothetical protein
MSPRGGSRKGAGRKPGPDGPTILVTVSVPESLMCQLDACAEQEGWNRSAAVTESIKRLVKAKARKR